MTFGRVFGRVRLATLVFVLVTLMRSATAADVSDITAALKDRLAPGRDALVIDGVKLDKALLGGAYAAKDFVPFWTDRTDATAIFERLKNADQDGLEPKDYEVAAIEARQASDDPRALADLDLLLTQGLARFGGDVHAGRIPLESIDPGLAVFSRSREESKLIADAVAAPDLAAYLEGLAPNDPRYARLKRALRWYRDIAAKGGWPAVPDGQTLKPGMRDPRVRALRERLAITGDIFGNPEDPDLFDSNVERAVRIFQQRHGLDVDGAVGRQTRQALNVTVGQRTATIVLNMKRRRWLATDLGKRFVFVNIADATVKLVDNDKTLIDMRAVVGRPYRRTPVFSDRITYLEFNPYWNVPMSIARRDLLPKARKDSAYLPDRGFKALPRGAGRNGWIDAGAVDWSTVQRSDFPYRLRQDPGPANALGRVKIMFPNKHSVYLHDTPSRSLFSKSSRNFSAGCIRLKKPLRLAAKLLSDQPKWDRQAIDAVIDSKKTTVVRMSNPVPVHISYLTAWVNKDGAVHFRPDVYGRDKRLVEVQRRHRSK